MQSISKDKRQVKIMAAVSAASLALVSSAMGQTTVSIAGSTALKNWLVKSTTSFTEIQPYEPALVNPGVNPALDTGYLTIAGTTYPSTSYGTSADGGSEYWANNGGSGQSYQLAPKLGSGGTSNSSVSGAANAVTFQFHESGSVEGILEMANDQLYTNSDSGLVQPAGLPTSIAYVTKNVDRNPDSGNAVWVNYNQIGASGTPGGTAWNASSGASVNNESLGNFYAPGVGQGTVGTNGITTAWVAGSASNPTPNFNLAGLNANGGQNAVQAAMSDAIPQQVFQNTYGSYSYNYTDTNGNPHTATGAANSTFNSNPLDLGYGQGNPNLQQAATIGTAGSSIAYQTPSVLDVPANAINPRTGTAFGAGTWNNASQGGLGNLNSQLTAITATLFVANPGTGLTQLDRTDADWMETTSRFANGAGFNMTTRDVNSGTRDVSSLDTGVDPTYSVGKDDDGNGNLSIGASGEVSIGSALRFSNKTAGGAELRPTVQSNRMSIGTLSINDAQSVAFNTGSVANPIRSLSSSDSVNGSTPYVQAGYNTISNGTYVIYQNEQIVTLKDMTNATTYANSNVGIDPNTGAQILTGTVQGDPTGAVVTLINNTTDSVGTAANAFSPNNPADGLLSQGYLIPSLMQVSKQFNGQGLSNSTAGAIDTGSITSSSNLPGAGGNYNSGLFSSYSTSGYQTKMSVDSPTSVFAGAGSLYGGNSNAATPAGFNGNISITDQSNTNGANAGGNWLFGNFNQNGIRDYSAVQTALPALRALISADQTAGASVPGSAFTAAGDSANGVTASVSGVTNSTVINVPGVAALNNMNSGSGATKGDLIVMGDFYGTGHFNGADLVAMAENCALADTDTGTTLSSATLGANLTNYQNGVLVKNAAMAYFNSQVAQVGSVGANAVDTYIRQTGAAVLEAPTMPAGAFAPPVGTPSVDPVSGLDEFTFDPNGVNTFNNADVTREGTVDFNDAVLVDNATNAGPGSTGLDYTNLGEQIAAVQPAPAFSGFSTATIPISLTMLKLSDTDGTVIDTNDVNVVNSQLTGSGTTNWYSYNLHKTGTNTITYARTGGAVNVYPNAAFQISGGTVVDSATIDPFSGTGATAGNHVAVTVDSGAKLQFATNSAPVTLAGLTIDVASGSQVNLNNNHLFIDYGSGSDPVSTIYQYLQAGYNGGNWNGTGGIVSSAPMTVNSLKYGLGLADSRDANNPAGLSSGQIEVKYTLLGDAKLAGTVNGPDLAIVAANFNQSFTGWDQGDFQYDGVVKRPDRAELAANYNPGDSGANSAGDDAALYA
ncbi:MAG: hypothetical protein ABSC42_15090, partial [Tepidisphaeraceae bacterium]